MSDSATYCLLVLLLFVINGIIGFDIIWTIRTKRNWGKAIIALLALMAGFGLVYYIGL